MRSRFPRLAWCWAAVPSSYLLPCPSSRGLSSRPGTRLHVPPGSPPQLPCAPCGSPAAWAFGSPLQRNVPPASVPPILPFPALPTSVKVVLLPPVAQVETPAHGSLLLSQPPQAGVAKPRCLCDRKGCVCVCVCVQISFIHSIHAVKCHQTRS